MEGVFDFLEKGGPILWSILGLSIILFTLIIERLIFFYRIREEKGVIDNLFLLVKEGRYDEVHGSLNNKKSLIARALYHILLTRDLSRDQQKEELELFIMGQKPKIYAFLNFIAVAVSAAPVLGLLGTVTGMIKVFGALGRLGSPDAQLLAGGISEALYTTAAGLVVAIPGLFLHNFLTSKAEDYISKIHHKGMMLISHIGDEDKKA